MYRSNLTATNLNNRAWLGANLRSQAGRAASSKDHLDSTIEIRVEILRSGKFHAGLVIFQIA
jgi:hypothetical protein